MSMSGLFRAYARTSRITQHINPLASFRAASFSTEATSAAEAPKEPEKKPRKPKIEPEVIEKKYGSAVYITLNRPASLNALSLNMVKLMIPKYIALRDNPDLKVVCVQRSFVEKAFCAGGDIKAIYDDGIAWREGKSKGEIAQKFFRNEYILDHLITTIPQPHVAILNGVTMGGGVGISVHQGFRVATENAIFAMPETGIGFFTDVGASYFLPKLQGGLGMYFGLTGSRVKGESLYCTGIATHYVPSSRLPELERELSKLGKPNERSVIDCLAKYHIKSLQRDKPELEINKNRPVIDRCFGKEHTSLESIFEALKKEEGEFAKKMLDTLSKQSPTSLKVVFRLLKEGEQTKSLSDALIKEFRVSQQFVEPTGPTRDFFEGVRAQLIDKDKDPKWSPARLEDVSDATVDRFFKTVPKAGDMELSDNNQLE